MRLDPLPIDSAVDDIRDALRRARALVVVAAPGAGKTTRVPPVLLDAGPAIVLQPRRAAARAIARRIAAERGWTIGREVGWQVRFERNFDASTRLLIATEGILTARLQQDPLLSDFATIVLDEFHERSIHADLAIALSKQAMQARDDLRLVVMSATVDAARVSRYLSDCPVIEVPARLHPISIHYRPNVTAARSVPDVLSDSSGNVLCFQPGALEIRRTIDAIRPLVSSDVDVLPLHGGLTGAEQELALSADVSRRRVIVSTNIAETSVTVPGVTAVVDSGLEKVARYDPELAIDSLTTERITQASADQRAGRAGRIAPGVVHRLWDRTDRLRPYREPEIHRVDLAGVILDVLGWGGDPRSLDWFDPPRAASIEASLALLERLDACRGTALTTIGREMLRLPLPPRLARVVIAAGGHPMAVRAVSLLAERRVIPAASATTTSDLVSALDRWDAVPEHARSLASQLERIVRLDAAGNRAGTLNESELRRAVLSGYPDRVARRRAPHSNRFLLATGTGGVQTPDSGVRDAEFIVALDVQAPTRSDEPDSRIRHASAVEREWLEPTATDVEYSVDDDGRLRARSVDRYDALVLSERVVSPDPEKAADALAAAWLARPMSDADVRLARRLRFAQCDLDLATLVRQAAFGSRSLADVDLERVLPREIAVVLDRNAPEELHVPSGRCIRLEYEDDGSVTASVKLQELFGLAETPRLGPRREPVLLALLAPNGRPVQLTRDLKSFWDRTYPEVRKELRGRYPRHPWPDDPWSAVPTDRAKPRS